MKIHPTTGEVLPTGIERDKRPFIYLYMDGIEKMLGASMRPTDYRVLFAVWLRSPLDGYPWDTAAQQISDSLKIDRADVQRALRRLTEAGLIERPVRGKVAFVRSVAWRGKTVVE